MFYRTLLDALSESIPVTTIILPAGCPRGLSNVVGDGFNDWISHLHFKVTLTRLVSDDWFFVSIFASHIYVARYRSDTYDSCSN